jgi:DNA repair exonuclease SbcCD ATPase subunit
MNKLLLGGLIGAVLGMLGAQFYNLNRMRSSEAAIESLKAEQAAAREAVDREIAHLRQADASAAADAEKTGRDLSSLRGEINRARRQAQDADSRLEAVRAETLRNLENLSARLGGTDAVVRAHQAQLTQDLERARAAAQSGISAVSGEVSALKAEAAATRQRVEQALAELQRTVGDLGRLSGRIATNAQEIALLKQFGEREYLEFDLFKSSAGTRLGNVSVVLKSTDVRAQRYSLDVMIDSLRIEKKDRHINEPLQFYIGRNLYELVVNRVRQDQLTGYLSSPKVIVAR